MADDDNMPEGYIHEPSTSAFINHIGTVYSRRWTDSTGQDMASVAIRIRDHHVNTWGLAHGSFMAAMAEIGGGGGAYVPDGPPIVAIQQSLQFIAAPKLGELLEVHGWITKRTRSMVFTQCRGESDGKIVFTASAIHKVVGA
jgi:acyl-coenzyme A thioesterase PaaI-like protein